MFPHSNVAHPITPANLLLLSQVREIDGYLLIEGLNHSDITDLRFLRHLEVIHGHSTVEVFRRDYSLVVQDNPYLQTLSLASLSRIDNGGVRIQGNPQLCLVDTLTIEHYLADSVSQRTRISSNGGDCTGTVELLTWVLQLLHHVPMNLEVVLLWAGV